MNKMLSSVSRSSLAAMRGRANTCKKHKLPCVNSISIRNMHNPMFPQRAVPELDSKAVQGEGPTDFLALHGGKIALGAFGVAIALFYTWYKGGVNRNELEERITNEAVVEPYEIQEVRVSNKFKSPDFQRISEQCFTACPNTLSYLEFVKFVQSRNSITIHSGHLMDRLVAAYVQRMRIGNVTATEQGDQQQIYPPAPAVTAMHFCEVPLPRDYLLTVLNLTVNDNFVDRLDSLFYVTYLDSLSGLSSDGLSVRSSDTGEEGMDGDQGISPGGSNHAGNTKNSQGFTVSDNGNLGYNGNISSASTASGSGSGSSITSGNSNSSAVYEQGQATDTKLQEEDYAQEVSVDSAIHMIDLLVQSNQIPAEKLVTETGVKWPIKTYRRKEAVEMVNAYFEANKITTKPTTLSKDEFRSLFLSRQVCIWAECYRNRS